MAGPAIAVHAHTTEDQTGGDADAQGDDTHGDRLPGDDPADVAGTHAEGAEHSEVVSSAAHGQEHGVDADHQPQQADGDGKQHRNLAHVGEHADRAGHRLDGHGPVLAGQG